MAGSERPPHVIIKITTLADVQPPYKQWEHSQLPTDVLLLTVDDDEFLACYALLCNVSKSYNMGLGHMYIGEIGEGVEKVKASLVRCFTGSSQIGAAHSVVRSAIECLQPKVVFSVGFCGGLKKGETKLGDVVISSKLSTYGETKITYDREQWCGNTLNVSKNIGDLIRYAADGWQAPLSNPEALEVKVHRDAEVLTGLKLDSCPRRSEELLKQFPGAIAVEAEGQGVYAAAFDRGIEWVVIKGISHYTDGSKGGTKEWQRFSSVMAASVVKHILNEPDVLKEWRRYKVTNKSNSSEDTVGDVKDPLKILSTFRILPGKPFHKCYNRAGEVEKMTSLFERMSDTGELRVTTLYLTGPPGSGKTELARQFGIQFWKSTSSSEDGRPIVLTLSVDSMKSLLQSTKKLLDELGITKTLEITKNDQEKNLARLYLEELRKLVKQYPGKWLLILDNMFRGEEINSILPQPGSEDWGRGKVIVTSQDSDLVPACHEYAKSYSLKTGMNESDALNLLTKVSDIDVDEFAVELAKELEYFPLSLACSATYVADMVADRSSSDFSWKQFLILYRGHNKDITYRTFAAFNVYPFSMLFTSKLAAKRFAECSEVLSHTFDFLSYCALSPVPLVVISNFVKARLTSKRFNSEEIKAEISRCSLILRPPTGFMAVESITFHQVMGEAFKHVREEPDSTNSLDVEARRKKYISMLKSLIESLDAAMPKYDNRSVVLKILVSPHVKSFVSHGNSKTWNNCAEFVVLLQHLADSLYHVPGSSEAERIKYMELAYEIARNLPHPVKDIRYCLVLKSLGFYYREAHQLDKSVGILNQALALTENQSGNTWLALKSSTLNVLSWTYKLQKKLDLSEQTMKESIEIAKQAFGEQHEEIVDRLCNLAIVYREKYQMEKAKETVDEARRLAAEIATDERHLRRAQAANYSAKIYLCCAEVNDNSEEKQELLTTSLKLHSEALEIYENVLGENHLYVAGVCMTYAMVNKELKAYSLALEQVERAVKIYSDVEHVILSRALRYKTEVLLALGNAGKEAEQTIKRSIELSSCDRARFLLASALLQQKRFQEARTIFEEVLACWKSGVLPLNHIWIKQAEKLEAECDREIVKTSFP